MYVVGQEKQWAIKREVHGTRKYLNFRKLELSVVLASQPDNWSGRRKGGMWGRDEERLEG